MNNPAAVTVTDYYGFPIKVLPPQMKERADCDAHAVAQLPAWQVHDFKKTLPVGDSKIKELVRKGVPPSMRKWVWMETSGAKKKKESHAANYFEIMLKASENAPYKKDIEADCPRTFPDHPWVSSPDGQAALARVLMAYSVHNDRVGYCRAMNTVAALMLVVLDHNEEAAFWLLAALVEDILYPGTYNRNLEGCQIEMRALDELISQKLPRLHAHCQTLDFDINMLATDWYLCLFCTSIPPETCARVWDSLLLEGPKILFRVALALLKIYEENILKMDNAGELMLRMRNAAATMHFRDLLMDTAFDGIGSLSMATIDKYREQKQREVEADLAARGIKAELPAASSGSGTTTADKAAEKMKAGFGKFMSGMTKLTEKVVDKTQEQLAKLNTKDEAGAGGSGHPTSSGGSGYPAGGAPPLPGAPGADPLPKTTSGSGAPPAAGNNPFL